MAAVGGARAGRRAPAAARRGRGSSHGDRDRPLPLLGGVGERIPPVVPADGARSAATSGTTGAARSGGPAAPPWVERIERWRPGAGRALLRERARIRGEEDFFPAQRIRPRRARLARTAPPFLLQVESFDVHEPFDAPEPYRSQFGDALRTTTASRSGRRIRIRHGALHGDDLAGGAGLHPCAVPAKVAMVDRWLGELLDGSTGAVGGHRGHRHDRPRHDLGERGVFGSISAPGQSRANPVVPLDPADPGEAAGRRALTRRSTSFDARGARGGRRRPAHGPSLPPHLRAASARDGAAVRHLRPGRPLHRRRVDSSSKTPPALAARTGSAPAARRVARRPRPSVPDGTGVFVAGRVPTRSGGSRPGPGPRRPKGFPVPSSERPRCQERNLWGYGAGTARADAGTSSASSSLREGAPPEQLTRLGL